VSWAIIWHLQRSEGGRHAPSIPRSDDAAMIDFGDAVPTINPSRRLVPWR
jgi:hypothetical protein